MSNHHLLRRIHNSPLKSPLLALCLIPWLCYNPWTFHESHGFGKYVVYRLMFADQGKQTSNFFSICSKHKGKFAVSVFRMFHLPVCIHTYRNGTIYISCIYVHINIYKYKYICIYTVVSRGKWKPGRFSLIRLPFAHRTNGSLSFVRLLTKK